MLLELSIKNVVLIENLYLDFNKGLNVFTGETGAGKSILLDSISLALGSRANTNLIRPGTERLEVIATFQISADHLATQLLNEKDYLVENDILILRRVLKLDGRSMAYINDNQVSINFLREVGSTLVEVLSQFEAHGLVNDKAHIKILDKYMEANIDSVKIEICINAWTAWKECQRKLITCQKIKDDLENEKIFLNQSIQKIESLSPVQGEDEILSAKRVLLRNSEKILSVVDFARKNLVDDQLFENNIRNVNNQFNKISKSLGGVFEEICNSLDRTLIEFSEFISLLEKISDEIDLDPVELHEAEERLFALKAEARKHNVLVNDLPVLLEGFKKKMISFKDIGKELEYLSERELSLKGIYNYEAEKISKYRNEAAIKLETSIKKEFKPLKLNETKFRVKIEELSEKEWSPLGKDKVFFEVSTNQGMPFGLISKIASGGELSRFLLSLKLILADTNPVLVMIFDEVDSGIGGSTATAVGERLLRLSNSIQILVITHSPQVAALGKNHWHVFKSKEKSIQFTTVKNLKGDDREEEIARMLSGMRITDEARAAASNLLKGK